MTVKQLIFLLSAADENSEVVIEYRSRYLLPVTVGDGEWINEETEQRTPVVTIAAEHD